MALKTLITEKLVTSLYNAYSKLMVYYWKNCCAKLHFKTSLEVFKDFLFTQPAFTCTKLTIETQES